MNVRYPDLYASLVESIPNWVNKVNASSLLDIYRFRPIREAHQIRCPLLVVLVYRDLIAPEQDAMQAAHKLPYIELAMFKGRHFDLYAGEIYERAVQTEVRFFTHHFERAAAHDVSQRGRDTRARSYPGAMPERDQA